MKHSKPLRTAYAEIRRLKAEVYAAHELAEARQVNAAAWQEHAAARDAEVEQAAIVHDALTEQVRAQAAHNARLQARARVLAAEVQRLTPRITWPPDPAPAIPPLAPLRLAHPAGEVAS